MVSIFAAKHYPDMIPGTELDKYLSRGWYRMGQTIFTTHFLCFGDQFFSAIWIRLPLKHYQFSKSLRKLFRKNLMKYRVEYRPAYITPEKEKLYQKYKKHFPGMLAATLNDSLHDGEAGNIFNTLETAVYDGDQLIALSFFDLGERALASIQGIYDPDYQKDSLGLFTMLLEIDYGLHHQLDFFYPGYVVPGNSRFDYKLRIGKTCEYFNLKDQNWQPWSGLDTRDVPLEKMKLEIGNLQTALAKEGIRSSIKYYPLFEANLFGYWQVPFFDYPLFLLINTPIQSNSYTLCVWDPRSAAFKLLQCANFDDIQFFFNENYTNTFHSSKYFIDLITAERLLHLATTPQDMTKVLLNFDSI